MFRPSLSKKIGLLAKYALLVGIPVLGLLGVLYAGKSLPTPIGNTSVAKIANAAPMPNLLLLLAQITIVVMAARGTGRVFRWIGQPQVVGEMVAGILLGPSLLGWIAPDFFSILFPAQSLGFLNSISQIGLLIFMFLVGLELDPGLLRKQGHTVVVTSHVSIAFPFVLGALLAYFVFPWLCDPNVPFISFALFMGAAMSVTAFPVLARILTERNLLGTRVGAITLACAAIDDVTAWTILAGVMALVRASEDTGRLGLSVVGSALFVSAMFFFVRPMLKRWDDRLAKDGRSTYEHLTATLMLLFVSAMITEWLGVHALFGAFLAGAVLPKNTVFVRSLTDKLEDITVVLLLPLFFAFTGLRTSVGLISGWQMWGVCALVIFTATAGKLGGSAIAARATGMSWRDAGAIGIFMNTRGLMELIILNVGLDAGVISPTVFTIMVMMALVTTFMTTPLLQCIYPRLGGGGDRGAHPNSSE
jgi:Kef-type K+ transport system membrane component KefB